MSDQDSALSIIVPCHNEREGLAGILQRLGAVLEHVGRPYEVIVVDDGSTDGAAERVDSARFRLVRLRTIAVTAPR